MGGILLLLGCLIAACQVKSIALKLVLASPIAISLVVAFLAVMRWQRRVRTQTSKIETRRLIWERLSFKSLMDRRNVWCASPNFMIMEVNDSTHATEIEAATGLDFRTLPAQESPSCPCCFSDFLPDDTVALLPCGHIFCDGCLLAWVASSGDNSRNCPVCRASFVAATC